MEFKTEKRIEKLELALSLMDKFIEGERESDMLAARDLVHDYLQSGKKASVYVDLGLPSGKLWESETKGGKFTYHKAVGLFLDNLPTKADFEELFANTDHEWVAPLNAMVLRSKINGRCIVFHGEFESGLWSRTYAGGHMNINGEPVNLEYIASFNSSEIHPMLRQLATVQCGVIFVMTKEELAKILKGEI